MKKNMKNKIEIYKKQSIFAELKDFCHLSKEGGFIELTEWKNGEGVDVVIGSFQDRITQFSWGEIKAIKKLSKKLINKIPNE